MDEEYQQMIFETVSKLEQQENVEFELSEEHNLWICPMPESTLSERPYWLIVFLAPGQRGVCKWSGETDIDEFWFVARGFSMQASVEIAQLLADILFARAKRVTNERKLITNGSNPETTTTENQVL